MEVYYIGKNKKETSKFIHSEIEKNELISKKKILIDDTKQEIYLIDGYSLNNIYKYPDDRKYLVFKDGVYVNSIFREFSKSLLSLIESKTIKNIQ